MENKPKFLPNPNRKLMDQARDIIHNHHFAYRTEHTYCQWILRYIRYFGGKTHQRNLRTKDVKVFLSCVAADELVTDSTPRQELNAIVFLYKNALDIPRQGEITPARSKRVKCPPAMIKLCR